MSTWNTLTFNPEDTNYINQLDTLTACSEATATEVENARLGEAALVDIMTDLQTEIANAREGAASIVANLANYIKNGALTSSFDLNGQKVVNVADGVAGTDLVNLSQATALILAGASPTDIDITSVGVGTATNGQRLVSDGTNPQGEDNDLLTLDVGTLTANQVAGVNSGASALEAKDLTNIDAGTLTVSSQVAVAASSGLEDYDSDLELSSAALYLYDNG